MKRTGSKNIVIKLLERCHKKKINPKATRENQW